MNKQAAAGCCLAGQLAERGVLSNPRDERHLPYGKVVSQLYNPSLPSFDWCSAREEGPRKTSDATKTAGGTVAYVLVRSLSRCIVIC
jgi:hypothetical protein